MRGRGSTAAPGGAGIVSVAKSFPSACYPRMEKALLWVFIACATVLRGYFAFISLVDADEYQTLHSAWLVASGQMPYRDFIGMHTPLYWYLLAPLAGPLGEHPTLCLLLARAISFAMSLGIVWFCFALARRYWGARAGGWAAAAASCWPFLATGLAQVTTVVPMTLFTLAGLYVLTIAREDEPAFWPFYLSGALTALAVLAKQSPAVPAAVLLFLASLAMRGGGVVSATLRRLYRFSFRWLAGFVLALLPAALWLIIAGAWTGFVQYVFSWHFSQWFPLSPWPQLLAAALSAPLLALGFGCGLAKALAGGRASPAVWGLAAALLVLAASFCALLRPSYTHLVPVLALACVFAGPGLALCLDMLPGEGSSLAGRLAGCLLLLALAAGLVAGAGQVGRNALQARQAEFVQAITAPRTPVFAGYPVAFARPHAYEQWFTPPVSVMFYEEIQYMPAALRQNRVPVVVWDALLQGLVDRPLAATMRAHGLDPRWQPGQARLRAVAGAQEALRRFLADHYLPSAVPQVLVCGVARRPVEMGAGADSIELVAGGLYQNQIEGGGRVLLDGRAIGAWTRLEAGRHDLQIIGRWQSFRLVYGGP